MISGSSSPKRLRRTKLCSLEEIPETIPGSHLLSNLQRLAKALADNLFVTKYSHVVTGQNSVRTWDGEILLNGGFLFLALTDLSERAA